MRTAEFHPESSVPKAEPGCSHHRKPCVEAPGDTVSEWEVDHV